MVKRCPSAFRLRVILYLYPSDFPVRRLAYPHEGRVWFLFRHGRSAKKFDHRRGSSFLKEINAVTRARARAYQIVVSDEIRRKAKKRVIKRLSTLLKKILQIMLNRIIVRESAIYIRRECNISRNVGTHHRDVDKAAL